jgi:hypothetical protein
VPSAVGPGGGPGGGTGGDPDGGDPDGGADVAGACDSGKEHITGEPEESDDESIALDIIERVMAAAILIITIALFKRVTE